MEHKFGNFLPAQTAEEYIRKHDELMQRWQESHEEWMKEHGLGKRSFAIDGIVDPQTWFSEEQKGHERILILLREAYDEKNQVWDLTRYLSHLNLPCIVEGEKRCAKSCDACQPTGYTYNTVARWIDGIENEHQGKHLDYNDSFSNLTGEDGNYYQKRELLLRRAAIVNIKKSDGVPYSWTNELFYWAQYDKALLMEQISLIGPTLIICGGTYDFLCSMYDELPLTRYVYENKDNKFRERYSLKTYANQSSEAYQQTEDGFVLSVNKIRIISTSHANARISAKQKYEQVIYLYRNI